MRNTELIHSVAQSIVDKHYDEELVLEGDDDNDDQAEDFHSMFEPGSSYESFWDTDIPPSSVMIRNAVTSLFIMILAVFTVVVAANQPFGVGITFLLMVGTISVAYFANRIKIYTRNAAMVAIFGTGMLITSIALISTSVVLLFRVFNS